MSKKRRSSEEQLSFGWLYKILLFGLVCALWYLEHVTQNDHILLWAICSTGALFLKSDGMFPLVYGLSGVSFLLTGFTTIPAEIYRYVSAYCLGYLIVGFFVWLGVFDQIGCFKGVPEAARRCAMAESERLRQKNKEREEAEQRQIAQKSKEMNDWYNPPFGLKHLVVNATLKNGQKQTFAAYGTEDSMRAMVNNDPRFEFADIGLMSYEDRGKYGNYM